MKTLAFASAAHEFRNPLNAISASLDLLEPLIDHAQGNRFFKTAKNCSDLMLFLVRDILDYSQLESKSMILNFSSQNIRTLVDECIRVLKFKADIKGIKILVENFENIPDEFNTDGNRLKQILINLISNAIKYTQDGYVKIMGEISNDK